MIDVVVAGLETSVQDFPGVTGFWNQGFPPSGPFDSWSFRLANLLVGRPAGAAGLECQYVGPTLKFTQPAVIAVTGADMTPTLDATPVPLWQSVAVKPGQVLKMGPAKFGTRAYIAIAGGIDTVPWLGSRPPLPQGGRRGAARRAAQQGTASSRG